MNDEPPIIVRHHRGIARAAWILNCTVGGFAFWRAMMGDPGQLAWIPADAFAMYLVHHTAWGDVDSPSASHNVLLAWVRRRNERRRRR